MFVARGEAPFELTYGSSTLGPVATPVNSLLRQLEKKKNKELIKQAHITDHYTLAGPSRLQPPPEGLPWKQLILWVVLVIVVIILAVMARQLYRQMQESAENES